MKITKCENCLKQYDALYGGCPHHDSLIEKFQRIGTIIYAMVDKYPPSVTELSDAVPQEWLNYDFQCKYYSPKPKTVEAFL